MYCRICGKEIPDMSKFCSGCGGRVDSPDNTLDEVKIDSLDNVFDRPQELCKLTIIREKQITALLHNTMKIIINNSNKYFVEKNSSLTIELPKGSYQIEFTSIWNKTLMSLSLNGDKSLNASINFFTGDISIKPVMISLFCKDCGNQILGANQFCNKCGARTDDSQQDSTQVVIAPTNILSIAGLTVSVISLFINFFGLVGATGLVLSVISLVQINDKNENGKGKAILGIALGVLAVLYYFVQII